MIFPRTLVNLFFKKKKKKFTDFFLTELLVMACETLLMMLYRVRNPSKLTLVIRNSVRSIKLDSLLSVALWPVLVEDKGEVVDEDLVEDPPDEPLALDPGKHRRKRA